MEFDASINEEKLAFLRSNTILSPISLLKIMYLVDKSEKFRDWYFKLEGELLDCDYSLALDLEYELRLRAWQKKCEYFWKQNSCGLGLAEFADGVMYQEMLNSKKKVKK